jgi:pimeloyl-ACP methyl ester carboxylesterase
LAQFSPQLAARFDIVGFDPRGVDRSAAVRCSSDADLDELYGSDMALRSPVNFDAVVADTRDQIGRCVAKYGPSLRLYSTRQTAQDMDAIRAALSEEKLSYLGFSYGTLLGAAYAEMFPTRLRAMVLDGPEDPRASAVTVAEREAKQFEQALNSFDAWCRRTVCLIGPDARSAVLNAVEHARKQPVKNAQGREATAGWVFDAIFWAMYFDQLWPALVTAIDDLNHGRSDTVLSLADQYAGRGADGHYTNFTDAYETIACNDAGSQPTVEQIKALSQSWRQRYPLFGQRRALGLLDCTLWPVGHDPVPIGPAKGAPSIVVLAATGDPATPYEGAAALVSMLGTGTVVTRKANNHGSYLSGNACVGTAVHDYLIGLTAPASGLTCSG